jgi:hypothetical protein
MGWQPGQAASRTGRGVVEAHVPASRPSLLGIGAKPMAEDLTAGGGAGKDKGKGKQRNTKREDMKFVPLMKRERERIEGPVSANGSGRSVRFISSLLPFLPCFFPFFRGSDPLSPFTDSDHQRLFLPLSRSILFPPGRP